MTQQKWLTPFVPAGDGLLAERRYTGEAAACSLRPHNCEARSSRNGTDTPRQWTRLGQELRRGGTASTGRLGRLRQGLLYRLCGDDAFDARRRSGARLRGLAALSRRLRQTVPHAGFLPDFG